jgi:hypothetical protein
MADVSHHTAGDIRHHPDVAEMRDRYAQMAGEGGAVAADGMVLLAGLYCAISPWTVHFSATSRDLALNNLIMGLAVAALAFGFAMTQGRATGLSVAVSAIGIWLIVAPWIVARNPDAGMVLNNVIVGAAICVLGLLYGGTRMWADRAK